MSAEMSDSDFIRTRREDHVKFDRALHVEEIRSFLRRHLNDYTALAKVYVWSVLARVAHPGW